MRLDIFCDRVSVPLRCGPVLLATEKSTVPFPVPLAPDVTVMKLALVVAVQPQPLVVMTFTVPVPPFDPKFCAFEERENPHATPGVTFSAKGVVCTYSPTTAVS